MAVDYLGANGPDGMCVGTAASEKLAFHGDTPVVQQSAIASATATATSAMTAVNSVLTALRNYGLIET